MATRSAGAVLYWTAGAPSGCLSTKPSRHPSRRPEARANARVDAWRPCHERCGSADATALRPGQRADLPSELLALAEPLACVVNGSASLPGPGRRHRADYGGGTNRQPSLRLALLAGARAVIVSQPSAQRRALAERLGATVTVDPTTADLGAVAQEVSGGVGIDSTIICIGVPELVNQALRRSRIGGRVNVFAGLRGEGWTRVGQDRHSRDSDHRFPPQPESPPRASREEGWRHTRRGV